MEDLLENQNPHQFPYYLWMSFFSDLQYYPITSHCPPWPACSFSETYHHHPILAVELTNTSLVTSEANEKEFLSGKALAPPWLANLQHYSCVKSFQISIY